MVVQNAVDFNVVLWAGIALTTIGATVSPRTFVGGVCQTRLFRPRHLPRHELDRGRTFNMPLFTVALLIVVATGVYISSCQAQCLPQCPNNVCIAPFPVLYFRSLLQTIVVWKGSAFLLDTHGEPGHSIDMPDNLNVAELPEDDAK